MTNLLQTFYVFYMYGARVWNVEGMDGKVNDQRPGITILLTQSTKHIILLSLQIGFKQWNTEINIVFPRYYLIISDYINNGQRRLII